ncbi:hypothetical protein M8J76_016169 [Diaphorina citri]|nr:hypothetical protein M8J75_014098 [Diaphorina citri]KAI5750127.1 hypothetical protein M8J76_013045 [Diaphorina citri]KAI5750496.1 hypothetical protein M8J76_016169 [Diaphorina citri]KAI5754005.1 hypothetical protein M8J77_004990 [Diaphorina citri]
MDSSGIPNLVAQQCETSEEYFTALRKWVQDAYLWQSFYSYFPYYLMINQNQPPVSRPPPVNSTIQNVRNIFNNNFFQNGFLNFNQFGQGNNNLMRDSNNNIQGLGTQCQIPPFWKRIVAETIDFFLLLILKFFITYVVVNYLDLLDFTEFQYSQNFDMKTLYALTQEILVLEIFFRIIVVLYEAFCLSHSAVRDGMGGSTAGKSLLKLRVVRAESIVHVRDNTVIVYPGTDLGFSNSLVRSFTKNIHVTIMIPISYLFFFFPYNRTVYDLLSKSIVIEEPVVRAST